MKYLIVDDHAPFRQLIRDFLPGTDSKVVECADGEDALRLYEEEVPDWVLMDIEMPGMDGLAALRAIRHRHPAARIVIVTQHNNPILREEAAFAGAIAFLSKDDLTQLRGLLKADHSQ